MSSNQKPIKMAMSLDGAKSVKIEEDDVIIFTMEEGPPIELRFVMPSVHKDGYKEGYDTPMVKSGKPAAKSKVGFLSPAESTKSNKSENTPMPFASPSICDSSMGSPSPFKTCFVDGSNQGFTQETSHLHPLELSLDCEEKHEKPLAEILAELGFDD
ncbi:hypothetical protein SEMRO_677_G185770.1 [Seminavis robusta]|uniref:Uncharacterized protein n=1 Tax=Seminavis robusta TaxID=568900 RepID=A0A9N8HLE4_9STRA|nr:hypothetical protein SEMRO_677_G185770.1 [Seminavis robusta]|eukprot:Sro677_g185770.1 n/a (157) ;mRNA; f:6342-6812